MSTQIFHNPRCSKSRQTLNLIKSKGIEPEIILYLNQVPDAEQLSEILSMLGIPAEKLIRKTEAIYKEKYKGLHLSEAEWIQAMLENPKLIERPIVIKDGKAVLGRPPENVLDLIDRNI